jgi:hypothetical protein
MKKIIACLVILFVALGHGLTVSAFTTHLVAERNNVGQPTAVAHLIANNGPTRIQTRVVLSGLVSQSGPWSNPTENILSSTFSTRITSPITSGVLTGNYRHRSNTSTWINLANRVQGFE